MGLYERLLNTVMLIDSRNRIARREARREEGLLATALYSTIESNPNQAWIDMQLSQILQAILFADHTRVSRTSTTLAHQEHPFVTRSKKIRLPQLTWKWNFFTSPDGIVPHGIQLNESVGNDTISIYFFSIHKNTVQTAEDISAWSRHTPFYSLQGLVGSDPRFILRGAQKETYVFDKKYEFMMYDLLWYVYLYSHTTRLGTRIVTPQHTSDFVAQPT